MLEAEPRLRVTVRDAEQVWGSSAQKDGLHHSLFCPSATKNPTELYGLPAPFQQAGVREEMRIPAGCAYRAACLCCSPQLLPEAVEKGEQSGQGNV